MKIYNSFDLIENKIHGVEYSEIDSFNDHRGSLTKIFNKNENSYQDFRIYESFFSRSKKNVFRGLHFTTAPYESTKIIHLLEGEILECLIDLRKESLTFKAIHVFKMNANNNAQLKVPKNVAHGFLTLSEESLLLYLTDQKYSKNHDFGVSYKSIFSEKEVADWILSERDTNWPHIDLF